MGFADRIIDFRRVSAVELANHPLNWRKHGEQQRAALSAVLDQIGFAGAIVCREDESGGLVIIDGHLRADVAGGEEVPVLVTDLDADEADHLLAVYDPIGELATIDGERLDSLLRNVQFPDESLSTMLTDLAESVSLIDFGADDAEDEDEPEEKAVPESWQVVAECDDEAAQKELFEKLTEEGHKCRLLTL